MNRVDLINSRKKEISFSIAMAIADNSSLKFDNIYKYVKNKVDSTIVITPNLEPFETTYDKKLNKLMSEVSELVFFDIKPYINNKARIMSSSYMAGEDTEIINKYNRNANLYERVGINFDKYKVLYSFYKDEGMKMIDSKIKKVVKKAYLSDLKRSFSSLIDAINYKKKLESTDKIFKKYNIKSIEDLIDFRNELLSYTVNENNYNLEEKKIILDDRKALCERVNDKNFLLSNIDATKMINKLDEVFNLEAFNVIFSENNWKDIIERIGVSSKNIGALTGSYASLMSSTAMCSKYFDKNNESVVYCMFPEKLFSLPAKSMNDAIIHEFVHSIDAHTHDHKNSFTNKYTLINEAITEYLSLKATQYLNDDILDTNIEGERAGTVYDPMLSLVEILKNSKIWDDVLNAKLNDNVVELEKKVGVHNMAKINSCFTGNMLAGQDLKDEQLQKLISSIEKEKIKK